MQKKMHLNQVRSSIKFLTIAILTLVTFTSLAYPTIAAPGKNSTSNVQKSDALQNEKDRFIEIDLSEQRLYAWEGEQLVYSFKISTGKKNTPTPIGKYSVGARYDKARMKGEDYDIADVPYVMYFYNGYAIHGAYWHNNFGNPMSHGCVNLQVKHAKQLYAWASLGTVVVVHK
jgi:lipoprotein-anchoring transpeptidase ErfK/SrfK